MNWIPADVPVEPDAAEARRLMLEELAKAKYLSDDTAVDTSWLDDFFDAINDFLHSISGSQTVPFWIVILVIVVVAVVVAAFLIFGVPRLRRRSSIAEELFEADDVRDAATMRRDAAAAAEAGDWSLAIAELFRAIARSLHERTLVTTVPGSTAHDVARRAATALPGHAAALETAATDFDAVRYLRDPGDRERYERMRELDRSITRTRPVHDPTSTPDERVDA